MSILRRKPRVRIASQPPTVSIWLDFNDDGATTLAKLETLCAKLRRHGASNKQPIYGMRGIAPGHVSGLSAHVPWHTYPNDREATLPPAPDFDLDFDETGRPL